ncbi:MAG: ATP-binding protein [Acidobacteriota bacterium]|nr:ATP-binding protein [Acidobacteriota bacterium]
MKRFLPTFSICGLILLVSALHFLTPVDSVILHQIYQRLYYIPIILASLWYGWRGGLGAALLASLSYVPHIALHWQHQNYDYALNQYAEIALFFVIGAVTGWLGDQKRREYARAERINAELQTAYAELRQTVGQLLQAERLSSLAEIASSVVHEVRNPLGAIKGAVEILEDELATDSPRREFAQIAKTEVERIDKIVQEFFHFARAKEPNRQLTSANEIIHAVKLLIENQAAAQRVEISEELDKNLPLISLDAEQIKQVLLNLAINALQTMPTGGNLVFRTFQKDNKLYIETEDTGCGIGEAVKAKIFDPFFTTKDKGLGLGLSVVYKIVTQHNGQIEIFDTPKGTKFVLTFTILVKAD